MTQEQLEGKWLQFKGALREKWGELTDSQIEETAGRHEQVVGLLEERYGYTKERAEEAIAKLSERLDHNPSYSRFWQTIEEGWQDLQKSLATTYNKLRLGEVERTRGKRELLAQQIQSEYNLSRSEAFELLDDWAFGSIHLNTKQGVTN
ncbi:MAG TPA: CsbD family protein [Fimbriimonas sp.]|nr:CsbD family protein [Fimbriimonas sp.]